VSRWGLLLLAAYVLIGLRYAGAANAVRAVVWVTAGVIFFAALKVGAL
jgi:hypothetical protein